MSRAESSLASHETGYSYSSSSGVVALRASLAVQEVHGRESSHNSVRLPGTYHDGSPREAFTVIGEVGGVYSLNPDDIPLRSGKIPEGTDLDYCIRIVEKDTATGSTTDHFVPQDCIVGASDEFVGWLMREP